jgi:hypothetical protein
MVTYGLSKNERKAIQVCCMQIQAVEDDRCMLHLSHPSFLLTSPRVLSSVQKRLILRTFTLSK